MALNDSCHLLIETKHHFIQKFGGLEQNLGGLEPLSPIASAATAVGTKLPLPSPLPLSSSLRLSPLPISPTFSFTPALPGIPFINPASGSVNLLCRLDLVVK